MAQQQTSAERKSNRLMAERLVVGYLTNSGQWHQQPEQRPDPRTAEVLQALLALTDEYERRYKAKLAELVASWDVSPASPRRSFTDVLDTVFLDGCNWGRVVTVFISVGMFLRKCSDRVTPQEVADWSVDYLMGEQLSVWISAHGGWMGLAHFYREGDATAQLAQEGHVFRRFMTVAGAGLALLTLGSLLANKA